METVDKLECLFQKAEADLDLVYKKLENECGANCDGTDLDKDNPVKLLKSISEVRQQYKALVEDAKEIQKAQEEAMLYFKDTLSKACEALTQLQVSSGLQYDKPEELTKVEELLNIKLSQASLPPQQTMESDSFDKENNTGSKKINPVECHSDPRSDLSAFEKRRDSEECIEITEDEFNSVSSLVRGRVKLADVNSTYKILWHYFKENKKSLTRGDMYRMGLRVSGMTGEAKLNVLKSLKLLSISKKDEVKLL